MVRIKIRGWSQSRSRNRIRVRTLYLRRRNSLERYQLGSEMKGSRPCAGFFCAVGHKLRETNDRDGGLFGAFVVNEGGSATINGQQFMRLGEHARQWLGSSDAEIERAGRTPALFNRRGWRRTLPEPFG
ncbi:hypothetical protein EHI44_15000 [Rhizobium leguminosarum]|nr:hypothetical protein EHI44_15000 [Rhizobium leguminosarum]